MNPNGTSENLARLACDLLCSISSPVLASFVAAWPADLAPRPAIHGPDAAMSSFLPVLRFLSNMAADEERFGAILIRDICRDGRSLEWRQTYTAGELGGEFMRNYGWTEILGPNALLISQRIACGFLLLGPHTLYPSHRHEAEEIYVPLSGTANWQQGDLTWREKPPGAVIHHASEEPHAMHTGAQPLLALYLWRSDNLGQKARLEPVFPPPWIRGTVDT